MPKYRLWARVPFYVDVEASSEDAARNYSTMILGAVWHEDENADAPMDRIEELPDTASVDLKIEEE